MHLDHFWLFAHGDWVIDAQWIVLKSEVSNLSDFLGVVLVLVLLAIFVVLLVLLLLFISGIVID